MNATEYIKRQLGADVNSDTDALKSENEELRKQLDEARARIDELEKQVFFFFINFYK